MRKSHLCPFTDDVNPHTGLNIEHSSINKKRMLPKLLEKKRIYCDVESLSSQPRNWSILTDDVIVVPHFQFLLPQNWLDLLSKFYYHQVEAGAASEAQW